MRNKGIIRKMDELGRIVMPKEFRRSLQIEHGDALEVFFDSDKGEILYRKYRGQSCYFCKSADSLHFYREYFVCESCIMNLSNIKTNLKQKVNHLPPTSSYQDDKRRRVTMLKLSEAKERNPYSSQKELAQIIGVSQARVSQLMKDLRQKNKNPFN